MVHNGIEYGMMAAFAEGFDILKSKASDKLPEDEALTSTCPTLPRHGAGAAWSRPGCWT
jgi:6-phosphogluconate dehydrogenase